MGGTCLGLVLDETMSGEPMALKVINKINGKFLYRKNRFLSPELRRMLCNALIQTHFDYAWYPNLTEKKNEKGNSNHAKQMRKILPKTGRNASHIWRRF